MRGRISMPNKDYYKILEEIEKEKNLSWYERVENGIKDNKRLIKSIK